MDPIDLVSFMNFLVRVITVKKKEKSHTLIVLNRQARHHYDLHETIEAGLVLMGWEVKSLRQKKVQLIDSYVLLKSGEAWLIGSHITPLATASSHIIADPRRDRKLLLHDRELSKLFAETQQAGLTCVCTQLIWKQHLVKAIICLAKGKKDFDKRATLKQKEWDIQKRRLLKQT